MLLSSFRPRAGHRTDLRDRVALVTGGARGIGAAIATALADRGARLVLTDLDRDALDEVVAEIGADRAMSGIDLVLANAGIASYGSVLGVDPATFRRVVDVNITGVFHTVRAALPSVIERKGHILVASSLAAFASAPGLVAYNASKAGVEHLANALRLKVAHHDVMMGTARRGSTPRWCRTRRRTSRRSAS